MVGGVTMNENQCPNLFTKELQRLVHHMEAMRIADYVEMLEKPARLILTNFIAGLAKGLGIALGATLILALTLEIMRRIILLNIPGIGNFVAEVIHIIESQHGNF
jgi:hypothetical protein